MAAPIAAASYPRRISDVSTAPWA